MVLGPAVLPAIRRTSASAAIGLAMLICVLLALAVQLRAQTTDATSTAGPAAEIPATQAILSALEDGEKGPDQIWNWHVQNAAIEQGDWGFPAKYSGPQSLNSKG